MNILKRTISALLALVMVVTMLPVSALATETEIVEAGIPDGPVPSETEAVETAPETTAPEVFVEETAESVEADAPTSGTCGENVTWRFDEATGELTISGEGTIPFCDSWQDKVEKEKVLSIVVEAGITELWNVAFHEMSNVISITLPDTLLYIRRYAFMNCSSLLTLDIPESVIVIGEGAFGGCRSLKQVAISATVSSIGNEAFFACDALEAIKVSEENTAYTSVDGVLFNKDMKKLVAVPNMMSGTYSVPAGVEVIAPYAFSGAWRLTEVSLPASLLQIGHTCFYFLGNLKDVYYAGTEDQWEILKTNIAENNDSLFSATVHFDFSAESPGNSSSPDDVIANGISGSLHWTLDKNGTLTISGTGAMENYIPPQFTPWHDYIDQIKTLVIGSGVTYISDCAFAGICGLTSATIPSSVSVIGRYAFSGCTELKEIVLPGVKVLDVSAFRNCSSLVNVSLPTAMTAIEKQTFENCTSLECIHIPEGITVIEENTFSGCTSMTNLTMPQSLEKIGSRAFSNCTSLTDIVIPDGTTNIESGAFSGCYALSNIGMGNNVISIGSTAFYRCTSLTSINIPAKLTAIEAETFYGCTSLTNIELGYNITFIGDAAFADCDSLTDVTIKGSISSIGVNCFSSCDNLMNVTLPNSVTSIGGGAFSGCLGLTSVSLPYSVKSIGDYAFYSCQNLAWVFIPSSVTTFGKEIFTECKKMTDIYYSGSKIQWEIYDCKVPSTVKINYYSTGPDDVNPDLDDPIVDMNPSYGGVTEIVAGTAATPELNYLLDYLIDWKAAYDQWVDSVHEGLQDFGATEEESEENIIRQEAERMREHDQNTHSRYLTGDMKGYESQAYHALASFFYDKISSTVPDLSSVDLSSDWAETNLTDMVVNSMRGGSKTYFYGKVSVSIEAISYMSLRFGSMTIRDGNGSLIGPIIICSDTMEGRKALHQYMEELQDLGLNASFNIANAVYQDILGMSLTTLTSNYVNKAVLKIENRLAIKLDEKLGIAGVGKNLIKTLDECYSFYTWAKKCIDSGKQEDVSSALINIANLKFEDTTVSKGVTKKAMKELQKANQKMQRAFREYLEGTIVEKEEGFWRWLFGCPVSICVYNSAGEQIGYVGEDDIWYTDDISITELGGVKEIVSFTEDALSFTVTATDHGTMSCMFEQYDENFYPVGRLNYYNVILEPEQTFQVSVPETLAEKTETAVITSGGEAIYPDEYISSEDSAGVTISCSAVTEDGITGGTVSGTGTYIRGDCVILRAEAYEGFRFVGWMDGEYLVGTEEIYEFPAREDCQLAARFYKEKPIAIQLEADIGGTAIGESRYDSGETVTIIAIPASGYSFAGWYAGEILLSADAEYSFPASESLILRAAFAQSEHPYDLGDVNHDTKINAKDATLILQKSVGVLKDTAKFCEDCAEVSGDGKLNAKDSTLILQFSVGLRQDFPAQK